MNSLGPKEITIYNIVIVFSKSMTHIIIRLYFIFTFTLYK